MQDEVIIIPHFSLKGLQSLAIMHDGMERRLCTGMEYNTPYHTATSSLARAISIWMWIRVTWATYVMCVLEAFSRIQSTMMRITVAISCAEPVSCEM